MEHKYLSYGSELAWRREYEDVTGRAFKCFSRSTEQEIEPWNGSPCGSTARLVRHPPGYQSGKQPDANVKLTTAAAAGEICALEEYLLPGAEVTFGALTVWQREPRSSKSSRFASLSPAQQVDPMLTLPPMVADALRVRSAELSARAEELAQTQAEPGALGAYCR